MNRFPIVLLALLAASCSGPAQLLTLENTSGKPSLDEPFVVTAAQLRGKPGLLPLLSDAKGDLVPAQADDLDGDGVWDELAFVHTLAAGERTELRVKWVAAADYPRFEARTHVRYGRLTAPGHIEILPADSHGRDSLYRGGDSLRPYPYQTDGPAWENDKVAFRHYFDGRNVRDVFGKLTPRMVMDSVGIRPDGYPGDTYHVMAWWGRDIMNGARALGLGGLAALCGDSIVRLGVTVDRTTDNVDSTVYTRVADGPVRSIFRLDFYGWDLCGKKVDIHEQMTIWPGKYGYENRITTSELPAGVELITGIVDNLNDKPTCLERAGDYIMMATHDRQTYDKVWYMGMALLIDTANFKAALDAPRTGDGVTTTWCARLRPDPHGVYRYNCYAGWEISDSRFAQRDYFLELIRSYADEYSQRRTSIRVR